MDDQQVMKNIQDLIDTRGAYKVTTPTGVEVSITFDDMTNRYKVMARSATDDAKPVVGLMVEKEHVVMNGIGSLQDAVSKVLSEWEDSCGAFKKPTAKSEEEEEFARFEFRCRIEGYHTEFQSGTSRWYKIYMIYERTGKRYLVSVYRRDDPRECLGTVRFTREEWLDDHNRMDIVISEFVRAFERQEQEERKVVKEAIERNRELTGPSKPVDRPLRGRKIRLEDLDE